MAQFKNGTRTISVHKLLSYNTLFTVIGGCLFTTNLVLVEVINNKIPEKLRNYFKYLDGKINNSVERELTDRSFGIKIRIKCDRHRQ
jgi:hypothetical protein